MLLSDKIAATSEKYRKTLIDILSSPVQLGMAGCSQSFMLIGTNIWEVESMVQHGVCSYGILFS